MMLVAVCTNPNRAVASSQTRASDRRRCARMADALLLAPDSSLGLCLARSRRPGERDGDPAVPWPGGRAHSLVRHSAAPRCAGSASTGSRFVELHTNPSLAAAPRDRSPALERSMRRLFVIGALPPSACPPSD